VVLSVGIIALVAAAFRFQRFYRLQLGFLIAGACAPFIGNVMYVFRDITKRKLLEQARERHRP
jgi:hypothetical protein